MTFRDIFKSSFLEHVGSISLGDMVIALALAFLLGLFIFYIYKNTYSGVMYSASFGITLMALVLITTLLIMAVVSNVVLSLGMVGALSIVRFRTAIKDPRDTTYIFWAIICGICCGVSQLIAAALGTAAVFVAMLILGRIRNDERTLVIVRAARSHELAIEGKIYTYLNGKAVLRVKNTTDSSVEFIYEVTRRVLADAQKDKTELLTDAIYEIGDVDYVNIVTQSDEIGS